MKSPIRVLHVLTSINRGGAENHVMDLVRHQSAAGMDVAVAYLRGDGYWTRAFLGLGVRVYPLKLIQYGDPITLWRLCRAIRRENPSLIHAHMQPAELYTRLALAVLRDGVTPLVITKHVDRPFYSGPLNREVGRWVASRATKVICISESLRKYMVNGGLKIQPSKAVTVLYSLDASDYINVAPEKVRKLRAEWGAVEGTLLFGTVARFVPQKSLETLLSAFAKLLESNPGRDLRLVMVGRGRLETQLREHAKSLNIGDRITWAGFREDIPVVMSALDVFCLVSINEGFGLVLLEAMAAARPVVGTRVSSIPEIVIEQETGFLIPPSDPDAAASAMAKLLCPDARACMGSAGRQRLLASFRPERMFEETDRVYLDVLGASAQVLSSQGLSR